MNRLVLVAEWLVTFVVWIAAILPPWRCCCRFTTPMPYARFAGSLRPSEKSCENTARGPRRSRRGEEPRPGAPQEGAEPRS
jgi:hypothetical protein